MNRFCTKCTRAIPEDRARRGSVYCSVECKTENDRERRELLRGERCELCKRKFRAKPTIKHEVLT